SVDIDQRSYFSKLLCIALIGDPAVTNAHQPMRAPGFFRREKGKYQELVSVGDRITPEAFVEGMERCFKALDFNFYDEESLSEERWTELKRILASKTLSRFKKEIEVKKILSLGEDYLPANIRKLEVAARKAEILAKNS
ncbi:hypothetical protein, partial [Nostoc sp.]